MTTPPTPAGWYPDPEGGGGQQYWDGSAWTEHRAPATPATPEPTASEPGGAHRRPESDDAAEPGPTTPVVLPSEAPASTSAAPAAPSVAASPPDNRGLILRFGVACAALLALLVLAVVYAVFLHKDNTVQIGSGGTSTAASTSKSASATSGTKSTKTQTNSPGGAGQATDGGMTFDVTKIETAPSVKYQDAPVEKTAQGEFVIVHMTVLNSGDAQATFLGTLQKLKAGGTTYSADDEATFYLDGGLAELNPGDSKDLAIAFDVPTGTSPDTIELHGDPMSSGVEVPLS